MQIRKNAIPKPYTFLLQFEDGREQQITVKAESYHSAVYGLPTFAEVGRYKYKHIK